MNPRADLLRDAPAPRQERLPGHVLQEHLASEENEQNRIRPVQLRSDLDALMEAVQELQELRNSHQDVLEQLMVLREQHEEVVGELEEMRANEERRQRQEQRPRPRQFAMRLRPRRNNRR